MAKAKPKRERDQFKVAEMPLCPRKSRQSSPNPPPCPEGKLTKYSPSFFILFIAASVGTVQTFTSCFTSGSVWVLKINNIQVYKHKHQQSVFVLFQMLSEVVKWWAWYHLIIPNQRAWAIKRPSYYCCYDIFAAPHIAVILFLIMHNLMRCFLFPLMVMESLRPK